MTTGFSQQTVERIASGDPAWLKTQRRAAWQAFEKLPMPGRRDLEWQHFDLRPLQLDQISIGNGDGPAIAETLTPLPADLARQGVIFCDLATAIARHGDRVGSYLGRTAAAEEPLKFAALHAACWNAGAFLYVPRNVRVGIPLEVAYEFRGRQAAGFPHTLVVIEPGAEATLVQKFTGGPPAGNDGAPSLPASGTDVFVEESGRLHYISLQNFQPGVFDFTVKRAHVVRDAEIDWVLGMFGGSFLRYDVQCAMDGPGGRSFLYGVGVGDRGQQFGQFTRQHHRTGHTVSDLLFKNVLSDAAVSSYAGIIKVEKDANGTNAYQANRNLVLGDKVRCHTKPILEIESNQLRCTHGATVGRPDENQIFYLRSRGLTAGQARDVLVEAFLEPVLARIRVPEVCQEFRNLIHRKAVEHRP